MKKRYDLYSISEARDVLFGVATLWIVLFHSYPGIGYKNYSGIAKLLATFIDIGNTGVDVFLLLSGIGLYFSFCKDESITRFYKKRAIRILPSTLIVSSIYYATRGIVGLGNYLGKTFLLSLFVKNFDRQFWYSSLIILMYFLYPLIYKVLSCRHDILAMFVLIGSALASSLVIHGISSEYYYQIEILLTRVPIFIFGAWLGKYVYKQSKVPLHLVGICAAFLGLLMVAYVYRLPDLDTTQIVWRYSESLFAICFVFVSSYICSIIKLSSVNAWLIWIGKYSMEVYLIYVKLFHGLKGFFDSYDKLGISYIIPVFVTTMILAIILKKICQELPLNVRSKENQK